MTAIIPSRVLALLPSLGRENDHEVVATVRAIERILQGAGLDWHALAAALHPGPDRQTGQPRQPSFVDMAQVCIERDDGRLTARERAFVVDVCRRRVYRPTDKQRAWMLALHDRLTARAAA